MSIFEDEKYHKLCQLLMPQVSARDPIHRLGGYPQEVQGLMELECQLVTHGLYCGDGGGYSDPRRVALEAGASDWRLVLQLDSDEEKMGWMWGDVGRVYFWNRQEEIKAGDFENCWAILQCH